uniref:Uncharacterized protein n=1 Tax=Scleropages formosus TaxID=113540 RepID=A0A8C9V2V8_SCLFO
MAAKPSQVHSLHHSAACFWFYVIFLLTDVSLRVRPVTQSVLTISTGRPGLWRCEQCRGTVRHRTRERGYAPPHCRPDSGRGETDIRAALTKHSLSLAERAQPFRRASHTLS